ncbi:uncharacterized protein LOC133288729 [Gastrolobium bilobum]|uniref:uncharacterized protein LOC133288729 n=1 Tax=Gastrolobium bilobum TaxID=150636 RepID=UPI002AB2013C|nr:uncharacterized protein LOC133288729 [Gastrolobium bilobum]
MNDQPQMMGQSQILHNHQNYIVWHHLPPPYQPENPAVFPLLPAFNAQPLRPPANPPGRLNWKGNKSDKRKEFRRKDSIGSGPGYKTGNPSELQSWAANSSGSKGRRFHQQKRKFGRLAAPFAPRNTTSFIIRAKKSGGIASLVSPCPVTPAILPTPMLSPSTEVVFETAKEEWGVDGYGSMKGLIRLRSGKGDSDEDSDEIDGSGSERVEVEKRLDHDLSRFEMIYPISGDEQSLENRVDEQDTHIAQLEVENLTLKERIFLIEMELGELRRRVLCLETDGFGGGGGGGGGCGSGSGRVLENFDNDLAGGDVCSEKSVGNGDDGGGDDDNGDCV